MDLQELMLNRRSIRKFLPEALSEESVKALKTAALVAPTSKNCRSWEFVFVQDKKTIEALSKAKAGGSEFLEGAPLAVAVLADTTKTDVWVEDASIAATFIQLTAQAQGLGSCWAQMRLRQDGEGKDASRNVCNILGAPENFECECVIGIGKPDQQRKPYEIEKLVLEHIHDDKF